MQSFDFDKVIQRKNTHSLKWDGIDRLKRNSSEGMWDGITKREGVEDILPLWAADMDFIPPDSVLEALRTRLEHGVFGYCIRPESYFEAVSQWLLERHQWEAQTDWMLHSPGVLPAINFAIETFTQPNDRIVLQPPVYYRFYQAIRNNHREVVENSLRFDGTHYEMDLDHLEKCFRGNARMLLLCSPHNPVARVWSEKTLCELGKLCHKYQVLIVSDEIHSDLILPGFKHRPITSLSPELADLTITCIAPSKTFNLAGLRTATVVIPNQVLRKKMELTLARFGVDVSNVFGLLALEAAYREGGLWLDALLEYLSGNVDLVTKFFKENVPEIRVIQPEATHMVWLNFRALGIPHPELKKQLYYRAKVGLSDGFTYFGEQGAGFQRINIGCSRSILQEALERVGQTLG